MGCGDREDVTEHGGGKTSLTRGTEGTLNAVLRVQFGLMGNRETEHATEARALYETAQDGKIWRCQYPGRSAVGGRGQKDH